LAAIVP